VGLGQRWDLAARLLHWGLAVSIVPVYLFEGGERAHNWIGYLAALFVLIRLQRGLFKKFPRANLLAGATYGAIWGITLALALTGWLYGTDKYFGEEWISELHTWLAYGLLSLIGLHLAGLVIDSVRFQRRTWMRMIDGQE
jgi:cytochrome b